MREGGSEGKSKWRGEHELLARRSDSRERVQAAAKKRPSGGAQSGHRRVTGDSDWPLGRQALAPGRHVRCPAVLRTVRTKYGGAEVRTSYRPALSARTRNIRTRYSLPLASSDRSLPRPAGVFLPWCGTVRMCVRAYRTTRCFFPISHFRVMVLRSSDICKHSTNLDPRFGFGSFRGSTRFPAPACRSMTSG